MSALDDNVIKGDQHILNECRVGNGEMRGLLVLKARAIPFLLTSGDELSMYVRYTYA
ncbi:MAG: hypothetical protein MRT15_10790 [archaeon YNP-LCB-003-016]|uniref:hypothetical protein n=1 Tax=Candidatus Culexarchaeum yellowstonense TaxID=2928963 RepID=UPI0026F07377|nr:hypothetical protein [Candidatus Culexarchaeum yellowstonense]MCR6692869.1 hypothetical protein [Candidatus Culexarchaeum yellowstonense]